MNIQWDAKNYTNNFSFVHQYGEDVLSLLDAPAGALVVDLGCGNGALSGKLRERGYRVIGVDASGEMLAAARAGHPDIPFIQADAAEFSLDEKADAVFSNAVFHWIDREKQACMIRNIADQIKPNGQLVCEFGGRGCAEAVHSTLERCFRRRGLPYPRTFYFPTVGEYAPLLEQHGLRVTYAALFDRPTVQKSGDGLIDWIRMFVKKPFEGMDAALEQEILDETREALRERLYIDGRWVIDYVRIRIKAIRE